MLPLLWLVASACPSAGTHARTTVAVDNIPADVQADYESFATNCSKCHALARALNAPVTDVKHWDLYVARMMRTAGSAISPQESPAILRFLYWYTREQNKKDGRAAEDMGSAAPEPVSSEAAAPVAPVEASPAAVEAMPEASPYPAQSAQAAPEVSSGATTAPSTPATTPEGEQNP
jgi:hypothetical protein